MSTENEAVCTEPNCVVCTPPKPIEEFVPPRKCLRCDGRGWVSVAVGYDWRNEKCPDCKGSGERVGNA